MQCPPLIAGAIYRLARKGKVVDATCLTTEAPEEGSSGAASGILYSKTWGEVIVVAGSEELAQYALISVPQANAFEPGEYYKGPVPAEVQLMLAQKAAEEAAEKATIAQAKADAQEDKARMAAEKEEARLRANAKVKADAEAKAKAKSKAKAKTSAKDAEEAEAAAAVEAAAAGEVDPLVARAEAAMLARANKE